MTPNQLYKASGSKLSFKEWLNKEYLKPGPVKETEAINATGSQRMSLSILGVPVVAWVVGIAIIGGAIYYYKKQKA